MRLFYIIILLLNTLLLQAQNTSKIRSISINDLDELTKEYESFFKNSRTLLSTLQPPAKQQEGLWFQLFQSLIPVKIFQTNSFIPSQGHSLNELGIKWVSDISYNIRPGITESEDLFFRSRISTGLDWVLLGEGSWQKRKRDADVFKKEIQIDSLFNRLQEKDAVLLQKLELIQAVFDLHKSEIMKKYARLLEQQNLYHSKMFDKGLISYAVKLKGQQKLLEVNNSIALMSSYPMYDNEILQQYRQLPYGYDNLPDWNTIVEDGLLKGKEELLSMKRQAALDTESMADRSSLRVKLRYNYYDVEIPQNSRSFASIGASLSIPIRFKKQDEKNKYQLAIDDNKLKQERHLLKEGLIRRHRSFYSLKNQCIVIENELDYIQALMENEIDVFTKMKNDFSPVKYIRYTEEFIQKKIELLDFQQRLCEEYLIFRTIMDDESELQQVVPSQSNRFTGQKSTYLWKKDFERLPNEQIINLLEQNNIKNILLSPGVYSSKLQEFLNIANRQEIRVERLIGENSYAASDDGWQKLLLKLDEIKFQGFSGIHLDIEPHTFTDYKVNKPMYITRMNNIYQKAKLWGINNGLSISVSIPVNLPEKNAAMLADLGMESYIMAYGTVDQFKLLKKTNLLRETLGENYTWVLRLNDFFSSEELAQAEAMLRTNNVSKIGYYDLSQLINKVQQ